MKRYKVGVLVLALALVAGACRGDDGGAVTAGGGGDGEVATGVGVTSEPCPDAVNPDNGCIFLGIISDLTKGPFAPLAVPLTDAQKAFWAKVNADGGIGGYDVDVTTYVRDNEYTPATHKQKYDEIKGEVLGLAQTLGSPTTAAIIDDLVADSVVSAPASWTSAWAFQDVILESGTNYCMEAMNSVDYAAGERDIESVMAVHFAGDYGDDAAAGGKIAAERLGLQFSEQETTSGPDNQAEAISAVVRTNPDLVLLTVGPTETAVIVGQAAARGYQGLFVGTSPTWNPGLLESAAAPALQGLYLQSSPWGPWDTDSAGHQAMRDALGEVFTPNDGAVAGWAWSYPIKAALEAAVDAGDLTRDGLLEAAKGLSEVDYQGMLPAGAGNYSDAPNEAVFRQSVMAKPDPAAPTGVSVVQDFFVGDTARDYDFTKACFEAA